MRNRLEIRLTLNVRVLTAAATLLVVMALTLVAAGCLAALVPAMRAARVDPVATLRLSEGFADIGTTPPLPFLLPRRHRQL